MRGLNSIVNEAIEIISAIKSFPISVVTAFRTDLMDLPLSDPTVAVGVDAVEFGTDKLSAYSGMSGDTAQFSVPVDVTLRADIYLSSQFSGFASYDALTYIVNALFYSGTLTVAQIQCDKMHYDSTFMCTVLPVKIKLHDRICGDTRGNYLNEL